MKTVLIKRYGYYIALSLMLIFCAIGLGFAQSLKTPYPIIFVHGTGSNNNTWGTQDKQFDNIVDYLEGAGLKLGDSLKLSLNYQRTLAHFNTTKEQDVHLFNTNIGFGDFYTVSFDVRASGTVTTVNGQVAITSKCLATDNIITVNHPSQFTKNDILRIKDEFMQVTGVNGNLVSVNRHLLGTVATEYSGIIPIYNLSNQSNQASIAKQGYALKLAIDAIIKKTNAKKVILVGHSMGGLAAREYIKNYANNNVAKIVTVGTPHYGTNVTDFNNAFINVFLPSLDERSEAVRDLRTDISGVLAPYLFGGYESSVKGYYSSDINCDGVETSIIDGLNSASGYSSLNNIAHAWIASNWSYVPGLGYNDAVVLTKSEYISSDDTLMTNKRHDEETRDYYTLLRGLDEPDDSALAYEIQPTSTTKGFVTFTKGQRAGEKNPYDRDLFKINITRHTHLQIDITAGVYTGINTVSLLDADLSVRKSISHVTINPSISDDLEPGIYYIQVYGTATPGIAPDYKYASYNYPYTINTTATVIPDPKFSISPTGLLTFYDVILGQYHEKNIMLTNNGTSTVAVSNLSLSGIDAGQFIITTPTTFAVQAGMNQTITLRFKPTSAGVKNASIKIESNSTDNPAISVALTGTGTDHAAKTLVINNDPSYSFGDVTVTGNKINTFTFQNTGSDPLLISSLSITGTDAGAFTISPSIAIPFTLQTGAITSVAVEFSPTTIGSKSGSLVIGNNSDNYGPDHSIALFGNGTNNIYSGISGIVAGYEYWFDDSYSSRVTNSVIAQNNSYLNTNFQTTSLAVGTHTLHIHYVDKHGLWSSVMSPGFYKQPLAPNPVRNVVGYEYWFDNNYQSKSFVSVVPQLANSLNTNINSSSLS
ncbi:MAG: alpha/beta fold hydrolase, partial [Mucilaginibacter sp.]